MRLPQQQEPQQQAQPAGYAQAPSGLPPTQQYAPM